MSPKLLSALALVLSGSLFGGSTRSQHSATTSAWNRGQSAVEIFSYPYVAGEWARLGPRFTGPGLKPEAMTMQDEIRLKLEANR